MNTMENAFTSSRLTYRAIEDTEEHRKFFHTLQTDPVAFAQSDHALFRPQSASASDGAVKAISKLHLAVMIYLKPSTSSPTKEEGSKNTSQKTSDEDTAPADKPSTPESPIGMICLSGFGGPDSGSLYQHHRRCTLAIALARDQRRKGYGTEAINWALDWAFRFSGMHSVNLACFSYNTEAEKLYEKLGFVREGRLRDRMYFDRKWYDEIIFSMLEGEWIALRGIAE